MNTGNFSKAERIIIIDFGSQYSQLIARRIRELGVYTKIYPPCITSEDIKDEKNIKGFILSGGPNSVYDKDAPLTPEFIFKGDLPVLGICYGLQTIAHQLGGKVDKTTRREYGKAKLNIDKKTLLFKKWGEKGIVWMSHGDIVLDLPPGFERVGHTENSPNAVIENENMQIYGVQFHPEVTHTERGIDILHSFIFDICKIKPEWSTSSFIGNAVEYIRERVKTDEVLCAVSGGVDSSILAVLVEKAVHKKAHFVFVNTGLLREGEVDEVRNNLKKYVDLEIIDAKDKFISNLKGITDPEEKRKIIGHTFIEIFDEYAISNKNIKYLAQGTLYPDLIESKSVTGPSDEIKTHHNVGGLPEFMKLELIEPFKFLFKDEVRKVGAELSISEDILNRHPFPGPGLAVRIIGEVTEQRLEILRKADKIAIDTLKKYNLYNDIAQAIVVLLPVKSVGVMGDKRTYENPCVLRFVTTNDYMTADWAKIPSDVLSEISTRITNEVNGINRVIYDITTKPPATIEWE